MVDNNLHSICMNLYFSHKYSVTFPYMHLYNTTTIKSSLNNILWGLFKIHFLTNKEIHTIHIFGAMLNLEFNETYPAGYQVAGRHTTITVKLGLLQGCHSACASRGPPPPIREGTMSQPIIFTTHQITQPILTTVHQHAHASVVEKTANNPRKMRSKENQGPQCPAALWNQAMVAAC